MKEELEYFFLTELKSAKAMKIKVHHTGAVRIASQSKEHFDSIMVTTGNKNKSPPEYKYFFFKDLKSANEMKIKVHHTGEVRNASQPEQKTI